MTKIILNKEQTVNFLLDQIWDIRMDTLPDEIYHFVEYVDREKYGCLIFDFNTKEISDLVYRIFDTLEEELEMTYGRRITLNLSYMPTVPFYIVYILIIHMLDHYKNNGELIIDLVNRLTEEEIIATIGDAFDYGDVAGSIYNAYIVHKEIETDIDIMPQIIDSVSLNMVEDIKEYLIRTYISLYGVIRNIFALYPNMDVGYAYTQLSKPHIGYRDKTTKKITNVRTLFYKGTEAALFPKDHRLDVYSNDIIIVGGINDEKR